MRQVGYLFAAASVVAASLVGCGNPTKFESAKFGDSAAIAKEAGWYWNHEGWWSLPKTANRLAITEFSVEYVTQNESRSGADGLSVIGLMEMGGMGKRQRVFESSFKQQLPGDLYAGFVQALEAQGYSVVTMDKITTHPAFTQINGAAAGKTGSASGRDLLGRSDNSQKMKFEIHPVAGLPVVDDGFLNLKAGDNAKAEAHLLGELGADAGLRVRLRVALDDDGRTVLDAGSRIFVTYDIEKAEWEKGKPAFWSKSRGSVVSKQAMRDDVPVITKKEFEMFKGDVYQIDSARYRESLLKMYPAYARMAAVQLKG